MKTSLCRSCGQEIVWVEMSTGKLMPLDVKPTGKVITLTEGDADPPAARFTPTYTPHFATCPDAAEWRIGRQP